MTAERSATARQRAEFEAHCLPYRSELFGAAMRLARQPDDASDLVQDTLLRAFAAWPRFERDREGHRSGDSCRAWLHRILLNCYINTYRKRVRHHRFHQQCPDDTMRALYGQATPHIDNACERAAESGLSDEVSRALDGLAGDQRAVVEMADLRGVRYRDIADVLGIPVGTVMSRLFRARRTLERRLSAFAAADYGIRRAA